MKTYLGFEGYILLPFCDKKRKMLPKDKKTQNETFTSIPQNENSSKFRVYVSNTTSNKSAYILDPVFPGNAFVTQRLARKRKRPGCRFCPSLSIRPQKPDTQASFALHGLIRNGFWVSLYRSTGGGGKPRGLISGGGACKRDGTGAYIWEGRQKMLRNKLM